MNERILAWALNRLLACALRPVAVPNGNRLGRLRPSGPIGIRARTMTPRLSRSACSPSIAGWAPYIIRNASPSSCSAPESSRGQSVMPAADQPLLESPATQFAIGGIDRIFAALAGIKPRDQRADHRRLVFLHQIPQRHVDRHAPRLNPGDGLGAVFAPAHHELRDRSVRIVAVARELTAQQLRRIAHVFLAILQHCRLAVFAPAALADRLGNVRLVDAAPSHRCRRRSRHPTGACAASLRFSSGLYGSRMLLTDR